MNTTHDEFDLDIRIGQAEVEPDTEAAFQWSAKWCSAKNCPSDICW